MSSKEAQYPIHGGCGCGAIRYSLKCAPLVVHCCHCHFCQRETGTAFAINAPIESDNITLHTTTTNTQPVLSHTPSSSGLGQDIARCPTCQIALWSYYGGNQLISFVRVGSLDVPDEVGEPAVFLYMGQKVGWFRAPEGARVFEGNYEMGEVWGESSLERVERLKAKAGEGGEGEKGSSSS